MDSTTSHPSPIAATKAASDEASTRRIPTSVAPAEWHGWQGTHRATLCFVIQDHKILLIRKKRGLGAGKINGPGGKVEGQETVQECAARETQEELLIEPLGLEQAGRLRFQFIDGYGLDVTVFRASGYRGTPTETAEAVPLWVDLDEIPFGEMWEDDELWFPSLLAHEPFKGRFVFDGERMLDYHLEKGRDSD